PAQNLLIAVAVGTAVGVNSLVSRYLGAKNTETANRVARNGLFVAAVSGVVFLLLGLFCSRAFFSWQSDDETVITFGQQYLTICLVGSFGVMLEIMLERLLFSTGKTFYTMWTQGLGAVVNLILDPIFIFVFGWGIIGAAVATVAGQIVAMLLALWFNVRKNRELSLSFRGFRPHGQTIRAIYQIGVPSILLQAISSVMTFAINLILKGFSEAAINVFGVYFKLQSFIFMPVFGLNNGMVPIVAYNYGARDRDRIQKAIGLAMAYAIGMMAIGTLLFSLFPDTLLSFFNADSEMIRLGRVALPVISFSFPLAGFCIICSSSFQALGKSMFSLIISATRQLLVLVPAAYLLSLLGNVDFIWWAFPGAEIFSLTCSALFLWYTHRKVLAPLSEPAPATLSDL
ncbi:MAG: MATE family efflux transporter, partial [Clostridia bacterium]|nr:MATE family efflux transporter [Clostridia bacterium]